MTQSYERARHNVTRSLNSFLTDSHNIYENALYFLLSLYQFC